MTTQTTATGVSDDAHPARDARPFSLEGGSTGVLLIHGFSGVPGEMRGLGDYLAAHGYAVECPLLAGHGSTQEHLATTTWRDWMASAQEGLARLRTRCSTVTIVGFSMGGAIALRLSSREAVAPPAALVCASTPLGVPSIFAVVLPVARKILPFVYPLKTVDVSKPEVLARLKEYMPIDVDPSDKKAVKALKQSVNVSVEAVYQLSLLLRGLREVAPRVTTPVLLLQAERDEQVPRPALDTLYDLIGSRDKEKQRFAKAGHMLFGGPDREEAYARIVAFLEHVEATTATTATAVREGAR